MLGCACSRHRRGKHQPPMRAGQAFLPHTVTARRPTQRQPVRQCSIERELSHFSSSDDNFKSDNYHSCAYVILIFTNCIQFQHSRLRLSTSISSRQSLLSFHP